MCSDRPLVPSTAVACLRRLSPQPYRQAPYRHTNPSAFWSNFQCFVFARHSVSCSKYSGKCRGWTICLRGSSNKNVNGSSNVAQWTLRASYVTIRSADKALHHTGKATSLLPRSLLRLGWCLTMLIETDVAYDICKFDHVGRLTYYVRKTPRTMNTQRRLLRGVSVVSLLLSLLLWRRSERFSRHAFELQTNRNNLYGIGLTSAPPDFNTGRAFNRVHEPVSRSLAPY